MCAGGYINGCSDAADGASTGADTGRSAAGPSTCCEIAVADDVVAISLYTGQQRRVHHLVKQFGLCFAHRLGTADDQPAETGYYSTQQPEP